MVFAASPFMAKVGVVELLAFEGFQQMLSPFTREATAGENVAVCAFAVPPPAT
jgi:hypothetical protein